MDTFIRKLEPGGTSIEYVCQHIKAAEGLHLPWLEGDMNVLREIAREPALESLTSCSVIIRSRPKM